MNEQTNNQPASQPNQQTIQPSKQSIKQTKNKPINHHHKLQLSDVKHSLVLLGCIRL
jgi:hypothetical protein